MIVAVASSSSLRWGQSAGLKNLLHYKLPFASKRRRCWVTFRAAREERFAGKVVKNYDSKAALITPINNNNSIGSPKLNEARRNRQSSGHERDERWPNPPPSSSFIQSASAWNGQEKRRRRKKAKPFYCIINSLAVHPSVDVTESSIDRIPIDSARGQQQQQRVQVVIWSIPGHPLSRSISFGPPPPE